MEDQKEDEKVEEMDVDEFEKKQKEIQSQNDEDIIMVANTLQDIHQSDISNPLKRRLEMVPLLESYVSI